MTRGQGVSRREGPGERWSAPRGIGRALVGLALFGGVVVAWTASTRSGATAPDRPALDGGAARVALASVPAPEGVSAGVLAFHQGRLEARPGDLLARRGLVSVHLLRFRANGDRSELHRADRLLEGLAARDPDDPSVHAQRAALALASHRFDDAVASTARSLELTTGDREGAVLDRFDALWAAGRYAEARTLLEEASFPFESPGLLAREARLLDGLGQVEAARDRMQRVVELVDAFAEPRVVQAWARVELGHFRHHSGDPQGAVAAYLAALERVPGYPGALEGLGWIAFGVDEDPVLAEALFQRALLFGGHLDLYPVLAEVALARGARGRAEDYRRRFLEAATADPEAERLYRRPLATLLAADPGTLDRALALARADLAVRRDRGAWALTGRVLLQAGRREEAVEHAERALEWGAADPNTLATTGEILVAAGEARRGRKLLRAALEGRSELGPRAAARIEALLDAG